MRSLPVVDTDCLELFLQTFAFLHGQVPLLLSLLQLHLNKGKPKESRTGAETSYREPSYNGNLALVR